MDSPGWALYLLGGEQTRGVADLAPPREKRRSASQEQGFLQTPLPAGDGVTIKTSTLLPAKVTNHGLCMVRWTQIAKHPTLSPDELGYFRMD